MPRGVRTRHAAPRQSVADPGASAAPERPELRPEPRADDSRARAEARAAQLREHHAEQADAPDKYYIPEGAQPDGWTYEWKRKTVYGAADPAYEVELARQGWDAVPIDRHPEFMPHGHKGKTIERDGMILMERPTSITEDARRREHRKAIAQVRGKEEALSMAPQGQFARDNKGSPMAKVSKSYEAIPIPD